MVFKDNTFFSYVFLATTVILFAGHAHGANLCDNAPNKQVCNSIVGSRTNPRDAVVADLHKMVYQNKAARAEAKKQAESTEINICINIFESCIYYNKLALSYLNDGNRNVARDLIGGNIDSYQKCDDTFKNSGMNNPVAKSTKLLKDMASTGVYLANLI
uniref:Pectinesterase inhibitor domain-containing protein n=1 Tax=Quercus lobata TaxID=97700 RepID=A0A7N2LNS1_QUELO